MINTRPLIPFILNKFRVFGIVVLFCTSKPHARPVVDSDLRDFSACLANVFNAAWRTQLLSVKLYINLKIIKTEKNNTIFNVRRIYLDNVEAMTRAVLEQCWVNVFNLSTSSIYRYIYRTMGNGFFQKIQHIKQNPESYRFHYFFAVRLFTKWRCPVLIFEL